MKSLVLFLLISFVYTIVVAQNEPYYGGVGRGDVHVTQTNTLIGDALIYYGGVGRGDVHLTQTNTLLGDPLIYYGGVGRGDVHLTQTNVLLGEALIYTGGFGRGDNMLAITSQLNKEQVWIGPMVASNNLFSNGANWALGYAPKIGNIKVDNAAVRDMQLVANVEFDTLQFQNNTSIKAELGDFNFKLKHFSASTDRQLFKTNGLGSVVIALFNNGKSLKFNVGNEDYNPVTITNKNTTQDSIAVRVKDVTLKLGLSGDTIKTPHVQRTWIIKKENPNVAGVDFVFEWDKSAEFGVMDGYYLNHNTGTNWELASFQTQPTVEILSGGARVRLSLSDYMGGFSPFSIGNDPSSPLPVELLSFTGTCFDDKKLLRWSTASEKDSWFYLVEHSTDGQNWLSGDKIPAAGNSNSLLNYEWLLDNRTDLVYVRLQQHDLDGAFTTYGPIVVNCENENSFGLFPNPTRDAVNVVFSSPQEGNSYFVEMQDLAGKKVYETQFLGVSGSNLQRINTDFAPGIYTVSLWESGRLMGRKQLLIQ
jgi:hypothetical protein